MTSAVPATSPMGKAEPTRILTVSGREVRWYRIPSDRVLKHRPDRTHRVTAKIERFSDTLWIATVVEVAGSRGTHDSPTLAAAEAWWTTWMEKRTEPRW